MENVLSEWYQNISSEHSYRKDGIVYEKKGVFLLASAAIAVSTSVKASQMPLSINESVVIKENDLRMLGSNFEWEEQFEDFINSDLSVNVSLAEAAGQYPLPGSRMAGSSSRVFQWKKAVGPYGRPSAAEQWICKCRMRLWGIGMDQSCKDCQS